MKERHRVDHTGSDEPPQRLESAVEPGYRTDDWRDQQRARTVRQSESTRIY